MDLYVFINILLKNIHRYWDYYKKFSYFNFTFIMKLYSLQFCVHSSTVHFHLDTKLLHSTIHQSPCSQYSKPWSLKNLHVLSHKIKSDTERMWTEKLQNGNQSISINFNKDSHNNLLRSDLNSRSCLDEEHGLSLDDSLSTPRHTGDGVPLFHTPLHHHSSWVVPLLHC